MNKVKNISIYIIVCVVIFASFKMPEILLGLEDNDFGIAVYDKAKEKNKIDVEAEKIYLVKAINEIESEYSSVSISSNNKVVEVMKSDETGFKDINKELIKLNEYNILGNFEINVNDEYNVEVIDKFYKYYKKDIDAYTLYSIFLKVGDNEYNFEVESKTGKILYCVFKKDNLCGSQKEIMENYIKYLDLYIIDDWKFEDGKLKSEKAKLVVSLIQIEESYILSIHSSYSKSVNVLEYGNVIR